MLVEVALGEACMGLQAWEQAMACGLCRVAIVDGEDSWPVRWLKVQLTHFVYIFWIYLGFQNADFLLLRSAMVGLKKKDL